VKLENIKRPIIIKLNENEMKAEISSPKDLFNKHTGKLVDILIAPTLVLSDKNESNEKYQLFIDPEMFSGEKYKLFNQHTYSLGKMVRLAELNLDNLIKLVKLYIYLTPTEEFVKKNSYCRKLEKYDIKNNFHKLTFENLRNILSCIIKIDSELHKIPGLETVEERNNFTKVYNNYIEDRNHYTHGILFFEYPSDDPILRVKTNNGNNIYLKYGKEVFENNLLTYNYINDIVSNIIQFLQSKINLH